MADISLFNRSLEALRLLGVAEGTIRERLHAAYQQWVPIDPSDLNEQDGLKLASLLDQLRGDMSDEQARRAAEEFVTLCESAIVKNRSW